MRGRHHHNRNCHHCNDFPVGCLCSISPQQRLGSARETHFLLADWSHAWPLLTTRRSSQLQSLTELCRTRCPVLAHLDAGGRARDAGKSDATGQPIMRNRVGAGVTYRRHRPRHRQTRGCPQIAPGGARPASPKACLGTTTSAMTRRHALPARQALPAQQCRAGMPCRTCRGSGRTIGR